MTFITMSRKEIDRLAVMTKLADKHITAPEAAEQMGLSVRQVRRLKKRMKKFGARGLIHRSRGKPSKRRMKKKIVTEIVTLLRTVYVGFGPTLAAEKLLANHMLQVSKESVRSLMTKNNLWKPKPKRKNKQHRAWRPRREHYGSMEQYDGCYHHWFEDRALECCLLLSVDDATGKITRARFDRHEGVFPTFIFWKAYVEKNGKPVSIYLDKFSTYKINHKAAEDNSELITQFERACNDLGIELITANSPEAKGRVERMFETLQDRLVKELRLQNISDIDSANIFLEDTFIPAFNGKFAVVPAKRTDLHRPLTKMDTQQINRTFSIHSERTVMNDFTIQFKNKYLQLDQQQPVTVCRKDRILVEEHIDDSIILKLRGKELRFTVLPERPKKAYMINIPALATSRPTYKPPVNHPWRRQFLMTKVNLQTTKG